MSIDNVLAIPISIPASIHFSRYRNIPTAARSARAMVDRMWRGGCERRADDGKGGGGGGSRKRTAITALTTTPTHPRLLRGQLTATLPAAYNIGYTPLTTSEGYCAASSRRLSPAAYNIGYTPPVPCWSYAYRKFPRLVDTQINNKSSFYREQPMLIDTKGATHRIGACPVDNILHKNYFVLVITNTPWPLKYPHTNPLERKQTRYTTGAVADLEETTLCSAQRKISARERNRNAITLGRTSCDGDCMTYRTVTETQDHFRLQTLLQLIRDPTGHSCTQPRRTIPERNCKHLNEFLLMIMPQAEDVSAGLNSSSEPMRVKRGEYGTAPEFKGEANEDDKAVDRRKNACDVERTTGMEEQDFLLGNLSFVGRQRFFSLRGAQILIYSFYCESSLMVEGRRWGRRWLVGGKVMCEQRAELRLGRTTRRGEAEGTISGRRAAAIGRPANKLGTTEGAAAFVWRRSLVAICRTAERAGRGPTPVMYEVATGGDVNTHQAAATSAQGSPLHTYASRFATPRHGESPERCTLSNIAPKYVDLCPNAPSWFETRTEVGYKIDTDNCCTIRVQSWTGDRDEVHFEPPKLAIDESEIQNNEISLVQHFYIGTKIKLDPGSELESFDLGSGKMLVQPGIRVPLKSMGLYRKRTGIDSRRGRSRIFACGNRADRCRWSGGFLGDLSSPPSGPSFRRFSIPRFALPPSALKTSLRATKISSLTLAIYRNALLRRRIKASLISWYRGKREVLDACEKVKMDQRRNARARGNGTAARKPAGHRSHPPCFPHAKTWVAPPGIERGLPLWDKSSQDYSTTIVLRVYVSGKKSRISCPRPSPGRHKCQWMHVSAVRPSRGLPLGGIAVGEVAGARFFINPFQVVATGAPYALKLQCDWPGTKAGMEPTTSIPSVANPTHLHVPVCRNPIPSRGNLHLFRQLSPVLMENGNLPGWMLDAAPQHHSSPMTAILDDVTNSPMQICLC
ncbi:hypothetical protein PR048_031500 [Dryococelus australis]|uniref:Uncharacterized protein n=1 Tax=Dryococelus australis TaxID=614101 RepID=A0ABQ9G5G1_9NEOP|nr:hypothetical protein PR048_031500 [Dryococelus australis]